LWSARVTTPPFVDVVMKRFGHTLVDFSGTVSRPRRPCMSMFASPSAISTF
jgi:predicted NBD/HSP70 family sugar kinase